MVVEVSVVAWLSVCAAHDLDAACSGAGVGVAGGAPRNNWIQPNLYRTSFLPNGLRFSRSAERYRLEAPVRRAHVHNLYRAAGFSVQQLA